MLRAAAKEQDSREAVFDELVAASGGHPAFDRFTAELSAAFQDTATLEVRSRSVVEKMALALQASVLIRAGNNLVSDAFCESRLTGSHGQVFGTLSPQAPFAALLERAFPG